MTKAVELARGVVAPRRQRGQVGALLRMSAARHARSGDAGATSGEAAGTQAAALPLSARAGGSQRLGDPMPRGGRCSGKERTAQSAASGAEPRCARSPRSNPQAAATSSAPSAFPALDDPGRLAPQDGVRRPSCRGLRHVPSAARQRRAAIDNAGARRSRDAAGCVPRASNRVDGCIVQWCSLAPYGCITPSEKRLKDFSRGRGRSQRGARRVQRGATRRQDRTCREPWHGVQRRSSEPGASRRTTSRDQGQFVGRSLRGAAPATQSQESPRLGRRRIRPSAGRAALAPSSARVARGELPRAMAADGDAGRVGDPRAPIAAIGRRSRCKQPRLRSARRVRFA